MRPCPDTLPESCGVNSAGILAPFEKAPENPERIFQFAGAGGEVGNEIREVAEIAPDGVRRPPRVEYDEAFFEGLEGAIGIEPGRVKRRAVDDERERLPRLRTHIARLIKPPANEVQAVVAPALERPLYLSAT